MPLERRVVDFGADVPFNDVPNKLQEHYGFEISKEVVRKIVLNHAGLAGSFVKEKECLLESPGVQQILAEADGGMIPIVEVDDCEGVIDKRKTRKVLWKEGTLCFSREINNSVGHFRATLQSKEELGKRWLSSAIEVGMGRSTKVHCIGDGAAWIAEQAEIAFGTQGSYLIDYYHVSEYLAAAAPHCNKTSPDRWRKEQQCRLKSGDLYLVLQELEHHLYHSEKPASGQVKACYRYLTNRLHNFDYLGAIMSELPIGSGEIESGHRHVVQKRMKRAGSWWKIENAEDMLQLLTLRVNGFWDCYWSTQRTGVLEEMEKLAA